MTPEQSVPEGFGGPKGSLGDEILARCTTVGEALRLLETRKTALKNAHRMMEEADLPADLRAAGNAIAGAVQLLWSSDDERAGGTLYSTFITISDREFVLVYKLDNTRVTRLDLYEEYKVNKKRRIELN